MGSSMVMPVMSPSSLDERSNIGRPPPLPLSGPPSLPCSRPPPLPSSHPPRTTSLVSSPSMVSAPHSLVGVSGGTHNMGAGRSMSPHVSCDKMMSISSMSATSPLPKSSLPTVTRGQNFVQPSTAQADVRLRRRLSDKDKERRLVRRSSSKRKDKENGGHGTTGSSGTGSSDSPARVSGSGIIQDSTGTAGSSSLDLALTDSVTSSSTIPGEFCPSLVGSDQLTTPNSRSGSNSSVLKRTSSAETGSNCGGDTSGNVN